MRKFMIRIGLLFFFCGSAFTGALAATEHAIQVDPAHGASRHDVTLFPWQEDSWTDGPGIFSASYTDHDTPDGRLKRATAIAPFNSTWPR